MNNTYFFLFNLVGFLDSCFYLLSLLPQFFCIYSYIYSIFLKSKKDLVPYLYYFLMYNSFIFIYLIALFVVVFLLPSFHFPKLISVEHLQNATVEDVI